MKKRIILPGLILLPVLLLTAQDHVVISEIVLQPSNAEYIKLYNPTDNAIDLSNYYLTDGTDPSNQKYYHNLPTGTNFWSGSGSDFIVRFPPGYSIEAQSEIIIAATTTAASSTATRPPRGRARRWPPTATSSSAAPSSRRCSRS